MASPYALSWTRLFLVLAVFCGAGYGVFLITVALRVPSGAELTGQFVLQPAVKAAAALGAACFAISDSMIGIGRFVLGSEALAVPIWWAYAASLFGITAGFSFGRQRRIRVRWPQG